jgi:transposase
MKRKYGNRKGCSIYVPTILPIASEIIKPGQSVAATYREIVAVCIQRGIKYPSCKTLERMLKASGLVATTVSKHRVVTTVPVSLSVDTQEPLACLQQVANFIMKCPAISTDVKERYAKQISFLKFVVGRKSLLGLSKPLTADESRELHKYKASQHKGHSAKAIAILMASESASLLDVVTATGHHYMTILDWIKQFNKSGVKFIEVKISYPVREQRIEQRRVRIIDILHTPPNTYNVNRASWNYSSIAEVYSILYQQNISLKTIERAVKKSGYTWRRARKVLTSPDPEYKAKVERILDTLQDLREGDTFFFIDEVGPYRVRKYGGISLKARDDSEVEPENKDQKSRGKVQFVAALEAVTNQLSWIFTPNKGCASVISLIEMLTKEYGNAARMFLTWDAITVHSSKALTAWISTHNSSVDGPLIEVIPLPSNSQFLNVIEAVFGGMKKAVICNSDYATAHEMQEAIARHFEERNQFYRDNPKRAGNKIWDKQSFDFNKLAGGLFKRM